MGTDTHTSSCVKVGRVSQRWSWLEKVQRSGTITPPSPQYRLICPFDMARRPGQPSQVTGLFGHPRPCPFTSHSLGRGLECGPDEAEDAAGRR